MLKTCMIATPSLVSLSIRETAPRQCKFAVAFLRSAWPLHHTCGCVQQPRLTLAPPAVARLAISGGIRCYDCFPKNPSSPVAPAQSRRRPALCSAAALSQLCLDLVALPARAPPLRPLYSQAAGSVTVTAPVARPASRPTCPAAPAPLSPPFGGVRATRAARNVRLQQPAKLGWTISDRALYRKREPVGPGAVAWRECVAPLHRDTSCRAR